MILPLAERYRVVAPDLRGAGWTDAPAHGYTVEAVRADVLALLDQRGPARPCRDREARRAVDRGEEPANLGKDEVPVDVYGDHADDIVGHVIGGAGHFLADDRPDAVATHALKLFGRVL